jgi:hypothetical protein
MKTPEEFKLRLENQKLKADNRKLKLLVLQMQGMLQRHGRKMNGLKGTLSSNEAEIAGLKSQIGIK